MSVERSHEHPLAICRHSIPGREWRRLMRAAHDSAMSQSLPDLLRRHRRACGISQLDLATATGTTQRHLSFLESGRAKPGRDLLTRLAGALALSMVDRNALFEAAGFLPPVPEGPLREAAYAPIRQAAWRLIEQQAPYPAMLLDADYNILASNAPLERLLSMLDLPATVWPDASSGHAPRNLLMLSFHPDGLIRYMHEPESWVPGYWQRIVRDAACHALVRDIAAFPHMQEWLATAAAPISTAPALLEQYVLDDHQINLLSMMTTPGVPSDITIGSLRVNLLFPADAATDEWLRGLDA